MEEGSVRIRTLFVVLITTGIVMLALPLEGQKLAATVQLPQGASPSSFALDTADEVLYVEANTPGDTGGIYAIYIPTATVIGSASLPGGPNNANASLAYSPATGQLYALAVVPTGPVSAVTYVYVANTKANPVTSTRLNVSGSPYAIAQSGERQDLHDQL